METIRFILGLWLFCGIVGLGLIADRLYWEYQDKHTDLMRFVYGLSMFSIFMSMALSFLIWLVAGDVQIVFMSHDAPVYIIH